MSTGTPVIKLLVAYTTAVAQASPDIEGLIDLAELESYISYSHSSIDIEPGVVYTTQVNYVEQGSHQADLDNFSGENDGYMDEIHYLRDKYAADICVLLINDDSANGLAKAIPANESQAFCVVYYDAATGYYSFPHEIGHLLGARHDYDNDKTPGYNHGFTYTIGQWRTIMSVEPNTTRILYWSNPNIWDPAYNNVPMGTVQREDNARVLNENSYNTSMFREWTTSGTMTHDENWKDELSIIGNVTVDNNVTLTIDPATTILFANGAQLIINGTIEVNGTSGDPVVFNRDGATGTWGGIQFNSGSSGSLEYCEISNAAYGISANSASLVVENCNIHDNSSKGIYLYNTDAVISTNRIYDNGTYGIHYSYYCDGTLHDNTISGNTYGIYLLNYCSPIFGNNSGAGPPDDGFNVITQNSSHGVYAAYDCDPIIGYGSSGYGGDNSIYSNGGQEVSAWYSCDILAQYTWWGTASPPANEFHTYLSTIDYLYPLSSDPNAGRPIPKISPTNKLIDEYGEEVFAAFMDQLNGNYSTAIDAYKQELLKASDTGKEKFILKKLQQCYKATGNDALVDFMKSLNQSKKLSADVEIMLLEIKNYWLLKNNNAKEAISNLNMILNNYEVDEAVEKNTLYSLGLINIMHLGDKEETGKYFRLLAEKYPNDLLTTDAMDLLNNFNVNNTSNNYEKSEQNIEENETAESADVSEYGLAENYPNPFNPSTTIKYELPGEGLVTVKVFDVLGKEVATLVNKKQDSGRYEAVFNGDGLASGMYIYKIDVKSTDVNFKDFSSVKKMLLVK